MRRSSGLDKGFWTRQQIVLVTVNFFTFISASILSVFQPLLFTNEFIACVLVKLEISPSLFAQPAGLALWLSG